jgi:hypothetical protein
MMGEGQASAAADELRTRWSDARSKAMTEGRCYRFAYQENSGKFKIAPDSPEYWDEGGLSVDDSDEKAWVLEAELTGGTHFAAAKTGDSSNSSSGASSGAWTRAASFQADGSAKIFLSNGKATSDAEFSVNLHSPGASGTTLKLRGSTAAVSTGEGPRP